MTLILFVIHCQGQVSRQRRTSAGHHLTGVKIQKRTITAVLVRPTSCSFRTHARPRSDTPAVEKQLQRCSCYLI
jgi:hypothetical protein